MLKAGYDKFYDQDQLHMNDLGYSLLSKSLRDEIAKTK
jgi:lysophospholipase L1-like esterase